MKYKLTDDGVFDTEADLLIPADEGNRHWQAYQEWLAAGNTPDPADPPPPPLTEDEIVDLISGTTDPMKKVIFEALFEMVNRITALEGNPAPTRAQFRTWLKGKL